LVYKVEPNHVYTTELIRKRCLCNFSKVIIGVQIAPIFYCTLRISAVSNCHNLIRLADSKNYIMLSFKVFFILLHKKEVKKYTPYHTTLSCLIKFVVYYIRSLLWARHFWTHNIYFNKTYWYARLLWVFLQNLRIYCN